MLEREYDLDGRAANNLVEFLREQQKATRVIPSDRAIVVERFRDEIGDWRLCILSPFGGRVHAAWGLALSARIRDQLGLESDAIWSDDGIIVHLPDAEEPPGADLVMLEPDEVEDAVVAELSASALFGARFRENAARALLIPRARAGPADAAVAAAAQVPVAARGREEVRRVPDHPRDLPRVPARRARRPRAGRAADRAAPPRAVAGRGRDARPRRRSPRSLLFDYVATYMYEGDTPNAERRAAALSLDRDLLRELLGQEELRDLIDPGALEQVEDDLQFRSEIAAGHQPRRPTRRAPRRRRPDGGRGAAPRGRGARRRRMLEELLRERRAIKIRLAGEERWIDAADAGLYRDALGAAPPGGLPAAFLEDVPDALARLVRRYAATHGPFTADDLRARYGVDCGAVLSAFERGGDLIRGELRPGRYRARVVRPRGPATAAPRLARGAPQGSRAGRPADARPLPARRGRESTATRRPARASTACARCSCRSRGWRVPADVWERDVLPRRAGAYSPAWIDQLCASGELVWIGAGALGRSSGRVALYFREDLPVLGPPPQKGAVPSDSPAHEAVRARLAAGACFFTDLLVDVDLAPEEIQEALWDLAWAGEATNDAFAPLRAPRLTLARAQRERGRGSARPGRFAARRRGAGASAQVQGRWSLTESLFRAEVDPPRAAPRARGAAARALRDPDPRAGAGRGSAGWVLGDLSRALAARDLGRGAPRILRRGTRRRSVRAARGGRAAARAEG